jgi:hypothetical protein
MMDCQNCHEPTPADRTDPLCEECRRICDKFGLVTPWPRPPSAIGVLFDNGVISLGFYRPD